LLLLEESSTDRPIPGGPILIENPVERRLAAILAADVAGYSRLMGVDEKKLPCAH
jgi:hypothetical protein